MCESHTTDQSDILDLAEAVASAEIIELHSGDREPGRRLSRQGRQWVVEGLHLVAEGVQRGR